MERKRRTNQGGNAVAVRRELAQPHRGQFERDAVRRGPPQLARRGVRGLPGGQLRKFPGERRGHLARRRRGEGRPQEGRQRNQGTPSLQSSTVQRGRARAAYQLVGTRLMSFASLTIAATSSR